MIIAKSEEELDDLVEDNGVEDDLKDEIEVIRKLIKYKNN